MVDGGIVVLGGTGFVGRHVVNRLAAEGGRVVVPTRRRGNAQRLNVLPTVNVVEVDVNRADELLRLIHGASAIVNLVGILHETKHASFRKVHVELTAKVIAACGASGVRRLIHMSALHANPDGSSRYLSSKGEAAATVATSGLDWTIIEPSVIFGGEDRFLNLFAKFLRVLPFLALPRADARFQPVFVGDVAECIVRALSLPATIGQRFPLCGPKTYTLRELVRVVGETVGMQRPIIPLGRTLGTLQAMILERLPGTLLSRDNLASMATDSICDCPFPAIFGVRAQALETIIPTYLAPEAAQSRYDVYRASGRR